MFSFIIIFCFYVLSKTEVATNLDALYSVNIFLSFLLIAGLLCLCSSSGLYELKVLTL